MRRHVAERDHSLFFVVDRSASMAGGFSEWSSRDVAARLCGSLALGAVDHHDRIGWATFGDGLERLVPPRRGLAQALGLIRDCLAPPRRGADATPAAFSTLLDRLRRALPRRSLLFVVSDGIATELAAPFARCARRHDLLFVRIEPPEWRELPRALLPFRDPASGRTARIDATDERVRCAWTATVARRREATSAALRRAGADEVVIEVPQRPDWRCIAGPLRHLFQLRALRGGAR